MQQAVLVFFTQGSFEFSCMPKVIANRGVMTFVDNPWKVFFFQSLPSAVLLYWILHTHVFRDPLPCGGMSLRNKF